ncbi:MAG: right-handed parallel beta-helix repeat-containing protein [Armatimonadota bacterium]
MNKHKVLIWSLVLFAILCSSCFGQTIIRVSPGGNDSNNGSSWDLAKKTVQAGIDAASTSGGEIWVAAGTYYEHITLKTNCYLYGGFAGTESQRTERNFNANKSILDGSSNGYVVVTTSTSTIACVDGFTVRNSGSDYYGIGSASSKLTITNNIISGNSKCGIYCCSSSKPTITNNTVIGNNDGIYCESSSSPTIANNIISANSRYGIYCYSRAKPAIANNTIVGNSSHGIYCTYYSDAGITNNIIAFNITGICNENSSPTLKNNCVYGNTTDYSGVTAGATDISVDPLLENWRCGKYHIQPDSLCIDAGDSSVVDSSWVDMDGQARVQGTAVDIGADESDGTQWQVNPPLVVRVSPTGDNTNDGSSWESAKKTVQVGIDAVYNSGGGEIWVAAGVYNEIVTLKANCYLYGGFAGTESQRQERDFNVNKSIIDNSGSGNVVSASGFPTVACIDGFTIRNGGPNRYGIRCSSSSPRISNNIIDGNNCGIYCYLSGPRITNNIISGNSNDGIYCESSSPAIANNIIKENNRDGIFCWSSNSVIANNTISTNGEYGINCYLSNPAITNNTITTNSYGIYYRTSSNVATSNNIVAFNTTGIYKYSGSGSPVLKNNCVYGNTNVNYAYTTAGATDISVDPLFESWRCGKFHIQSGSPCINAGDNSVAASSWVDMDGQARVQGASVDIGADESDGTLYINIPIVVRVSPSGDDVNDGSSWVLAKKTIQAGIDAVFANGGGEVWVAAGIYNEHIISQADIGVYGGFAGTESQRQERNFNANKSIIDGSSNGNVVIANGFSNIACIDGFTIRNSGIHCGISCTLSSKPTIINNTISENNRYGIYCYSSNPTITRNTISENTTYGIYCFSSRPTITNNTLYWNVDGICCTSSSSPTITNNVIYENYGNGISCDLYSNPTITNNSIIGNSSYGIHLDTSSPTLTNNMVAFNITGIYRYSGNPVLKNNCVYGNTTDYSGITAGVTDMSKDPLLENWLYGKCHIQPGSPCIDAGDSSVVGSSWVDMDGQSRIQGSSIDIGADESDGTQWTPNPPLIIRVSPNGNDSNNGSSWELAKKTIQTGIDTVYDNGGGGEVWVAAGVYNEHITLKTDIGIYGGFAGTESQRNERNINANKSIIDGSRSDHVVSARGFLVIACIDGFTIRNSGDSCYGIYCAYKASPTITNNTISGGICCVLSSSTIANNRISGNGSLGINCTSSNLRVTNNIISGNSCGIYCYSSDPAITNNTIIGNSSCGIACESSSPTLTNNIIVFNGVGLNKSNESPILQNNCVYGNTINYVSGITAGTTDISQDPLFRDKDNGDYHLTSTSPCINAGDDTAVQTGWVDMDGEARIIGSHVDIGADEYSVFDVTGTNAKNTKDTAYVLAANMVVSSVYDVFYYVQDINRTYGIRIEQLKGTLPQVNQIISVNGVLGTTTDGERCLLSYETPSVTGQETPKPLMITCKYIGGGDYSYDSAAKTGQKGVKGSFGLNNIGLLVTVCGTVADIDTANKKLYINDGSATVAVYYGSITLPSDVVKGAMIKATGACSCYRLDNENLSPLILLKDSNSIAALSTPQP